MKKISKPNTIIICFAALILFCNVGFLGLNILVHIQQSQTPRFEPGFPYAEMKQALRGVKYAGYLTNTDISAEHNDGEFLRAQYMLAPTILKFNTPDPHWNILNYTHKSFAVHVLNNLQAKPIVVSHFGKILAKKKQ